MTDVSFRNNSARHRFACFEDLVVQRWIPMLFAAAAFVMLLFSIWTLDRGFEITDESYGLLLAIYPKVFQIFVSAGYWVTSALWAMAGSLYWFRAVGLAIVLSGALILSLGVLHLSAVSKAPVISGLGTRIVVISSGAIAALHWDTYGVSVFFDPSYNLLATAASYSAIGLTFLTAGIRFGPRSSVLYVLSGCSLGVVLLCKFPAGLNISVLALITTAVFSLGARERIGGMVLTLIGLTAALLVIALSHSTLTAESADFKEGLALYNSTLQEPTRIRLLRYVDELLKHGLLVLRQFALPLACFTIYAFSRFKIFASIGFVSLVTVAMYQGSVLGGPGHLTSQITALVAVMIMILLVTRPIWAHNTSVAIMLGVLLVLPYCIALGTSNVLPPQILVSLGPWGVLFPVLAYSEKSVGTRRIIALALCITFSLLTTGQVLSSSVSGAYHMTRPLSAETEPVQIGALGVLRVDGGIRSFVTALTDAANRCRISPGRPFLGLYNIPGVALVIQAVPILTPWLAEERQAKLWLDSVPDTTVRSAVVALQLLPSGAAPPVTQLLPAFPSGYRLCGTATFPFQEQKIQLWSPDE